MQLVPVFDDENNEIGHVPNSSSKNAVEGVMNCTTCGAIATVHKASGKRSKQYYTMCTNDKLDDNGVKVCGATNQEGGKARQNLIKKAMRPTVEALESDCKTTICESEEPIMAREHGVDINEKPEGKPRESTIEEQPQTAENAVCTVKVEPEKNDEISKEVKPKDKPIGLFAILGAGIGSLIALVV